MPLHLRYFKNSIVLLFILIASFTKSYAQPSFIKDSLETYIQQGMKDWQVPGLSIVIVKDGKVVTMKVLVYVILTQQTVLMPIHCL
jgi:CubicO group peptidase (beta-lactamase class C family)